MKPCVRAGCPELVERGESFCPEHVPAPWEGSNWRANLDVPRKVWERMRRQVIRRARGRCERCGEPGREVNHKVPRSLGGPTVLSNLELLCPDHHAAETARIQRNR
jgi:5-methylcytosine-specific restriction enzyme A